MNRVITFFLLMVASCFLSAKQVGVGEVTINGQILKAVLFDDPAINPKCREVNPSAMQAMFYLNENSFAHGCWMPFQGEIHTQITRYDTDETKAYIFSPAIFKMTESENEQEDTKIKSLIDKEESLNNLCRGGSGDDPNTQKACEDRESLFKEIETLGWCWGPEDAIGAEKTWVKCGI